MKDPAIAEAFAKTYELANKLSITGTPSYVVGNEVVFGALGQDVLAEKIAAATRLPDGRLLSRAMRLHRLWTAKERLCALSAAGYAHYRGCRAPATSAAPERLAC